MAGEPTRPDRLWVPMIDGSERLGVAEVILREMPRTSLTCANSVNR